ncbi:MAG: ABC transporter permease [Holophaga sp.]|nr:ABC transporter permease [Holophaga sp.]
MSAGAERLRDAWAELRENPGRAVLQALGVVLGVASVLAGFSVSHSLRRQSEQFYMKQGGLDKLNVYPDPVVKDRRRSALQAANLGLRAADAEAGAALDPAAVAGVSAQRNTRARVRSPQVAQDRQVTGIGADYLAMEGYALAHGRGFSDTEQEAGGPVALLGTGAAHTFFPGGDAVGQALVLDGIPVTVVGTLQERVFRFQAEDANIFAWQNRLIALPAAFVQKRLQADPHRRLDQISFRLPDLARMQAFSRRLTVLLESSHRSQTDFRLDDLAARIRRQRSQGQVYDLVFLLSGVLALLGGGLVNVNIQMAALRERVREVGLKMALGASGREVFKGFMTEAMLLTALGSGLGLGVGVLFSWAMTATLEVSLVMRPDSFAWALLLAAGFGFGFALYPAWKASRLSPMEALRYE